MPNWLREPLLHFVLLGGVLFALDFFLAGRADDPRTIVVTTELDQEVSALFEARRGSCWLPPRRCTGGKRCRAAGRRSSPSSSGSCMVWASPAR